MRFIVLAAALLALPSCTVKDGFLKKPDGQVAHCHASGYGLIPMIMEANSFDSCMQYYRNQGYVEQ
jgi:hypothetical protein